ncbi:MAG: hypothetical protein US69_C0002G0108 [candidate division TM6 bacterium GW2011_GWF2_38_10]|nr:MAG: hypothetical protein US69_C0002G0108 [candidate division TM6 bacterium GW2011_GWF2_38_10]
MMAISDEGVMQLNIFKSEAWQLIAKADAMCWLILLGLFITSVVCVAIIVYKYRAFMRERKSLDALMKKMKDVRSFTDLVAVSKEYADGIGGRFLVTSLTELKALLDISAKKTGDGNPVLSDREIAILEGEMSGALAHLVSELEVYLPFLSTSAVAAPLVGLFGTIWGLIHSFMDISREKSADIATVAPGLAEALIVTLAGLVVAIPSLIAFHFFASRVRKFDHHLNDIGDRFLNIVKYTFTR